jgi:hypothetical protein
VLGLDRLAEGFLKTEGCAKYEMGDIAFLLRRAVIPNVHVHERDNRNRMCRQLIRPGGCVANNRAHPHGPGNLSVHVFVDWGIGHISATEKSELDPGKSVATGANYVQSRERSG